MTLILSISRAGTRILLVRSSGLRRNPFRAVAPSLTKTYFRTFNAGRLFFIFSRSFSWKSGTSGVILINGAGHAVVLR